MPDELVDIFDADGRPLGVAGKREAHRLGLWHYVFHCWLYRPGGGVVLQRRGPGKRVFPGLYDISAAGHYTAGEEAADGVREIGEELGIEVNFTDLTDLGTRTEEFDLGREFCRTYLGSVEAEMRPSAPEVVEVVEISVADGLALFSGSSVSAPVAGIRFADGQWRAFEGVVAPADVVPRDPAYYLSIFRAAGEAGGAGSAGDVGSRERGQSVGEAAAS